MKPITKLDSNINTVTKIGWGMMALLFFFQFINVTDKLIMGLVSVPVIKEYHLSPEKWGLIGSSFFWFYSLSALGVGILSDKLGTKNIMSWMGGIWSAIQFATIFAVSFPYLVFTRILLGAGEGPNQAVTMTMVGRFTPKEKLSLGTSIPLIGGNLSGVIMAPIIGIMIVQFGWRSAFILTGIIGVIWFILWMIFGKEHPHLKGSVQVVEKSKDTITWKEVFPLFYSKNFIIISLAGFATYWFYALLLVWIPNYLETTRGLSGGFMAIPQIVALFAQFGLSFFADALYKKTGSLRKSRVMILAMAIIIAGISVYLMTIVQSNILVITFMCLGALGMGWFSHGPALLLQLNLPKHHGKIVGASTGFATLASIISPLVAGLIIQHSATHIIGFNLVFMLTAALYIVSGVALGFGINSVNAKKSKDINVPASY